MEKYNGKYYRTYRADVVVVCVCIYLYTFVGTREETIIGCFWQDSLLIRQRGREAEGDTI